MKNRPRHICRGRFLLYTAAWHIIWRESHSPNRHPTISQIFQQPRSNYNTTILRVESKNDFDTTIPHPRSLNRQHRAAWPWLVHQLPRPLRHFLHHPRREGNRQAADNAAISAAGGEKRKTLEKWALRGVCPPSFLWFHIHLPRCRPVFAHGRVESSAEGVSQRSE